MNISEQKIKNFQKIVWGYYTTSGRNNLPWREKINSYRIWVSEVMLQQTQVDRVVPFFQAWMKQFPTVAKLANASQVDLLRLWKGLGYNSRALRMKQAAQVIMGKYKGKFPTDYNELQKLPGIGSYTAGAISAFANNQPVVIIETNIRRVFIHHFFNTVCHPELDSGSRGKRKKTDALQRLWIPDQVRNDNQQIHDSEILELVEQTLDIKNPRQWYWALMDYGSFLGRTLNTKGKKYNPNVQSKHYTKQSKFQGSDRQIRGRILELLLAVGSRITDKKLFTQLSEFSGDRERIQNILDQLQKENFIHLQKGTIVLKK